MIAAFFARLFTCLCVFSFSLYSYLEKQNKCTKLKMHLPKLVKEIQTIKEENARLNYQIECFENPQRLLQICAGPQYSHLKFPFSAEVLTLKEGLALQSENIEAQPIEKSRSKAPLIGAR